MTRPGIIVLLLAAVVLYTCKTYADSIGEPRCGPKCDVNQVCNTCGTACPPTCDDPNPVCTKQCILGCQCKLGLYTQPDGSCIHPKDCP